MGERSIVCCLLYMKGRVHTGRAVEAAWDFPCGSLCTVWVPDETNWPQHPSQSNDCELTCAPITYHASKNLAQSAYPRIRTHRQCASHLSAESHFFFSAKFAPTFFSTHSHCSCSYFDQKRCMSVGDYGKLVGHSRSWFPSKSPAKCKLEQEFVLRWVTLLEHTGNF